MTLQTLISSYISSKRGWAVAEQFDKTFSTIQDFDQQNRNALIQIYEAIDELLDNDFLSADAYDELQSYLDDLNDYLTIG